MARVSVAMVLVLCFSGAAVAGGNGSVKITGFADIDNDVTTDIDGVGVMSYSGGNGQMTIHVVMTGLLGEHDYDFVAYGGPVPIQGGFTTNKAGNGNGKATPVTNFDFSEFIDYIVIFDGVTPVAEWERLD